MVTSTVKMSSQQFLLLGEDPPRLRLELVNGEVAVSPSPTPEHSYAVVKLSALLMKHVEEEELGIVLGDVDTIFGEYDVRRPDILFFVRKRMHLLEGDWAVQATPDLCVEILSPSSITIDRSDKFEQYREAGVGHYWIVDPRARKIEGYRLRRGKYVLAGESTGAGVLSLPPFPDLKIPLSQLWWPGSKSQKR